MFQSLQDRILHAIKTMAKKGHLTEADVSAGLREIRLALLEADVNLSVVKDFIERVKEKAVGMSVTSTVTPEQQLIKYVYDELTDMLGGADYNPKFPPFTGQFVIMMAGLQGSGKTTTSAKLASRFKSEGRKPLLVAADLTRPAAIEQLKVLGKQIHCEVFTGDKDPVQIARDGIEYAAKNGLTPVIVDTAGRLSIDEELMDELARVRDVIKPDEVLLVLDSLTGQDAVETARRFNEKLELSGLVLTKMDGDARGGAALSMRAVTGKPVRLIGTGEKVDALDYFHPARMATRILGMGDVVSLVEKATAAIDDEEAQKLEKKLRREKKFDLEDFMVAMRQTKRMGSMKQILNLIPGMRLSDEQIEAGQKQLSHFEAIINSMTPAERREPRLLNSSRRLRIANGSGTSVQDINRFIQQFRQMQDMTSAIMKKSMPTGSAEKGSTKAKTKAKAKGRRK